MKKFFLMFLSWSLLQASEVVQAVSMDEKINAFFAPITEWAFRIIFFPLFKIGEAEVSFVLALLVFAAIFFTIYFKFINLRSFKLAFNTVRGKYSDESDPGEITHFQALSTALSATVGLGNIAGVAIAIRVGGPGATVWMVLLGILGMTSKFCECTLAVKYRELTDAKKVIGGGMFYLKKGLEEKGLKTLGIILALIFAIGTIGGSIGAGNMFQANQAHQQISETFGVLEEGWQFGLLLAVLVGAVIIGGIKAIAKFTSILVPVMCGIYVLAAVVVLLMNFGNLGSAIGIIFTSAFSAKAVGGGIVGGLVTIILQGVKRGVFSNEAGVGSAGMAHAAVKTKNPASEGVVALLEPFIDTVVVCTLTALVIVSTGMWNLKGEIKAGASYSTVDAAGEVVFGVFDEDVFVKQVVSDQTKKTSRVQLKDSTDEKEYTVAASDVQNAGGIWVTSKAFESAISWFPYLLSIAVFLFAFSTMISWSYYGEQAIAFLTNNNHAANWVYKVVFCLFVVVGSSMSLGSVMDLSDALFFMMVFPNLIGVFILLPVVKKELQKFLDHAKEVDGKG